MVDPGGTVGPVYGKDDLLFCGWQLLPKMQQLPQTVKPAGWNSLTLKRSFLSPPSMGGDN